MKIIKSISNYRIWEKASSGTIGFIPTMGALHKGHLSLIKKSKVTCDLTVVSIFVNPTQFSPKEDFNSYPRNLNTDIALLSNLDIDVLFFPNKESLYPENYSTYIDESAFSKKLEGLSRPHFFKGVLTIVIKLFNIIKPTIAYFGKKDIQQLKIIIKMVKDLNLDVKIIGLKTIREKSGLAMSSRNHCFSGEKKKELGTIYEALKAGKNEILSGNKDAFLIKDVIKNRLLKIKNIKFDYVEINSSDSLKPVKKIDSNIVISLAVFVEGVRLIDNIEVNL